MTSGVGGVLDAQRAGSVLALLSYDRLVIIELSKRAPPRMCAVPESVIASGGGLSSVAFDEHVPQLIYAATSLGDTLIFNGRARAPPPADAPPEEKKSAPTLECRWLDSIAHEPGAVVEPAHALATVKGYLFALDAQQLTARNVSTLYHTSEPQPAALVHAEPVPPPSAPPPLPSDQMIATGTGTGTGAAGGGAGAGGRPPRVLLSAGGALLVEGGPADGAAGGGQLRVYATSLPYDPPQPPTWPTYVMGAAVIGITAVWQLYKRRGKGDKDGGRGSRGGRGGRGGLDGFDGPGGPGGPGGPAGRSAYGAARMQAMQSAMQSGSSDYQRRSYDGGRGGRGGAGGYGGAGSYGNYGDGDDDSD